jgi:diaminopimelate epimerase
VDVQRLCHRRFGIGADGLIRINRHCDLDFEVDYFNADGSKSFCGNGARCAVAFAKSIGIEQSTYRFLAIDGEHIANFSDGLIHLKMNDVDTIDPLEDDFILHTGSPHYIHFISDCVTFDVVAYGKSIRYSDRFKQEGINVNAVEVLADNALKMKTYERGVEDETLSCGTGVTAAALTWATQNEILGKSIIYVETMGGKLQVSFERTNRGFENIWLIGPAEFVYTGQWKA